MLDFLSIDVGSLLFTLLNTLILFLVIKHFLFGRVHAVLEARQQEVAKTYQEAEDASKHASQLEQEYTGLMQNAKTESEQLIRNATRTAQTRSEEILAQARKDSGDMLEHAAEQIEQDKKRARNQLRGEISDLAVEVARKVVERDLNSGDHDRLISDFIDSVGDTQ
ncbi:F0F1 ATP synthase subunit B [Ruminococcus sp.]|uniref:F0F1 ATP synthase subunit B n=1 Tax=Ruminococcus sp. TaxID=41978 RepID=UPI0025DAFD15|nr:F0F1 ATP synthase subunit B [Ruminococcus sp.]MCI5816969.1 F0F1 ATP synthase subunit B [Ruminococcus sp.]MDD7556149.1 F0F1 ATP synthase subunit B [Ruminococcus sp.]MDY4963240.1 F0F1 ATP synthase subunit B [Ruminococcus callidus]